MTRALITGGAGFIGSNLVRRLLVEDFLVGVLVRPDSDLWRIRDVLPKIKILYADIADKNSVAKIISEFRPEGIFHLAASNIMHGRIASEEEVIKTNVLGVLNLAETASKISGLKFFINTGTFLEDYAKEIYSATKLLATRYISAVALSKNLPALTIRIFTPYGPYIQKGRLVEAIISKALKNEPIVLTSPKVTRDFIFVQDLVEFYLEAAKTAEAHKGRVFNAGSGKAISLKELSELVLRLTDSKSTVEWGKFKTVGYDNERWEADIRETRAAFSWRPRHSLEEGIKKTIERMREFNKI